LGLYVREQGVLSVEQAVKKMSFDTARQFNLRNRGVIAPGAWADLTIFDAQTVVDLATYASPHTYPAGIPFVIVNGVMVIDQGEHTGALPGKVLRQRPPLGAAFSTGDR
jgi:N-acyl-D-aspartate/D-glutamate deacylase